MKAQTRLDRLTERARALAPKPSRVLYTLADGTEKIADFDTMLADSGRFARFVDGSGSLRDVDRLLALWDAEAGGYGDIMTTRKRGDTP
ncbi:MAG: hypothetical protein E7422_04650 [Ruminococcaceae bacterium]|nr:hypothetical protein [Oscillospiraceae bacterium]